MVDARKFKDTYDLYRPTISRSATGEESATVPDTATTADEPCIFIAKAGEFSLGASGPVYRYDAVMYVPSDADLKPETATDTPDRVRISSALYLVRAVNDAAGRGAFKAVALTVIPEP
jgi:hypothetical protein